MVDLARQANMTDIATVPRASLARTVVGMAHFAGTGPVGQTCGSCDFWLTPQGTKIVICDKFRQLTGEANKPVSALSSACRHYVPRPE